MNMFDERRCLYLQRRNVTVQLQTYTTRQWLTECICLTESLACQAEVSTDNNESTNYIELLPTTSQRDIKGTPISVRADMKTSITL